MTTIVKELLTKIKNLNEPRRKEFARELPKVLKIPIAKHHFTDESIARIAKLARKHEGVLFDDIASARRFIKNL